MRITLRLIAVLSALLPLAAAAQTTSYPTQPIKIIVPFSAGGVVDVIARVVGEKLSVKFGQTVLVENKPGAGGAIATQLVGRAAADGYTLLCVSPGHVINPNMMKTANWNPNTDFRAVHGVGVVPNVFVVPASVNARTMPELVEMARKSPTPLTYGTAGNGTSNHLSALLLEQMANITLTHVPYRGQPDAINDLLTGRITMMPLTVALAKQHIESGSLRALAVTTASRSSALPNVPTVAESVGLPAYEVATWFGFVAPGKTPDAVVNKLSAAVAEALAMPDVKAKLIGIGMEMKPQDAKQFDSYIAMESDKWSKALKKAGIEAK